MRMTETISNQNLQKTPLHDLHVELGGKMVAFAGYSMPVYYPAGLMAEHLHTREKAGLFDVSHMGQAFLEIEQSLDGESAHLAIARAFETLVPGDIKGLARGAMRYTLLLDENGGILDDLMVTRLAQEDRQGGLFLVVNAAMKAQDFHHIETQLANSAQLKPMESRALLALQGPAAQQVLGPFAPGLEKLSFMQMAEMDVNGTACLISRSGYTGEDGFEISVAAEHAEALARVLLDHDDVMPIGLGARDSLRLEAGLCLYGHDIDRTTDPVSARLAWTIAKGRRETKGFPGAEYISDLLEKGAHSKRVGIAPDGRAPAREGTEITDEQGTLIGRVTSGTFGPSVGGPVAMGYVQSDFAKVGTEVQLMVRGRARPARIASLPFVPHRYYRK